MKLDEFNEQFAVLDKDEIRVELQNMKLILGKKL